MLAPLHAQRALSEASTKVFSALTAASSDGVVFFDAIARRLLPPEVASMPLEHALASGDAGILTRAPTPFRVPASLNNAAIFMDPSHALILTPLLHPHGSGTVGKSTPHEATGFYSLVTGLVHGVGVWERAACGSYGPEPPVGTPLGMQALLARSVLRDMCEAVVGLSNEGGSVGSTVTSYKSFAEIAALLLYLAHHGVYIIKATAATAALLRSINYAPPSIAEEFKPEVGLLKPAGAPSEPKVSQAAAAAAAKVAVAEGTAAARRAEVAEAHVARLQRDLAKLKASKPAAGGGGGGAAAPHPFCSTAAGSDDVVFYGRNRAPPGHLCNYCGKRDCPNKDACKKDPHGAACAPLPTINGVVPKSKVLLALATGASSVSA